MNAFHLWQQQPAETQAQLVERRGREAEARHAEQAAEVAARRAAGIPDIPVALDAFSGPEWGMPRKGGVWG